MVSVAIGGNCINIAGDHKILVRIRRRHRPVVVQNLSYRKLDVVINQIVKMHGPSHKHRIILSGIFYPQHAAKNNVINLKTCLSPAGPSRGIKSATLPIRRSWRRRQIQKHLPEASREICPKAAGFHELLEEQLSKGISRGAEESVTLAFSSLASCLKEHAHSKWSHLRVRKKKRGPGSQH